MIEKKRDAYYGSSQSHLMTLLGDLVPESALDIGCATGATLGLLRERGTVRRMGIELQPDIASEALRSGNATEVVVADLNAGLACIAGQLFDVIIASHVLEHLIDPWTILQELRRHLRPGGVIVGELPNIAHASVSLPLLLKGAFPYGSEGILDRTHLRFFGLAGARALLSGAGFSDIEVVPRILGPRSRLIHILTLGLAPHLSAFAWSFVARNASK